MVCEDRQTYRSVEQLGGADNTTMKSVGQRFLGMRAAAVPDLPCRYGAQYRINSSGQRV